MDSYQFVKILPSILAFLAVIIAASITVYFGRKLEKYKQDIEIRKKSESIAELLSIWISQPEDRRRLNELTFGIYLWLPKNIAIELSKTLSLQPGAKSMREIISDIRVYLLGEKQRIYHNLIPRFNNKAESKNKSDQQED